MKLLSDVLNKRHSTRNMSDADFEAALPSLAQQLEQTSFYFSYTDDEMLKAAIIQLFMLWIISLDKHLKW